MAPTRWLSRPHGARAAIGGDHRRGCAAARRPTPAGGWLVVRPALKDRHFRPSASLLRQALKEGRKDSGNRRSGAEEAHHGQRQLCARRQPTTPMTMPAPADRATTRDASLDHLVGAQQQRGGMFRPSSLAVFRLITSSNSRGLLDGRSPGLAPFRIRSM